MHAPCTLARLAFTFYSLALTLTGLPDAVHVPDPLTPNPYPYPYP